MRDLGPDGGGRRRAVCELQDGRLHLMSTVAPHSSDELADAPVFDLECIYDDPENPTALTVFSPKAEELTTSWITVDRGSAVSLDDIA